MAWLPDLVALSKDAADTAFVMIACTIIIVLSIENNTRVK